MSVLATDNFNRADADPIGGNWSLGTSAVHDLKVASNTCQASGATRGESFDYYNAITWPADQYSQLVETAVGTLKDWGPAVRCSNSAKTAYCSSFYTGDPQVLKFVAAVYTRLFGLSGTVVNGDTHYIEIQGTAIMAKVNGNNVGSGSDASIASGFAGIYSYEVDWTADNWEGGDFANIGYQLNYHR